MSENEQKDSPEQSSFRKYCRNWLSGHVPLPPAFRLPQSAMEIMTQEQMDYLCRWQKSAYDAGLVGCDYPGEYGGFGRTNCQRIANEEMHRAGTPYFPNVIALGMAAPTLFHHGSEELKKRFIPKILSGEEIWCQGFSEPDAGSDLANVQTFAEKKGDNWVINGQKIWTSLAMFASWMIILCRHDRSDKYKGLTYFIVPIKSALGKGVDVRPLIKMTGETGFNEVFFTDLEIPDSYRLDKVGNGWQVAMTTLLHERGAGPLITPTAGGQTSRSSETTYNAMTLVDLAKKSDRLGKTAADDPVIRDRIMSLVIRQRGFMESLRRSRVKGLADHPMRIPLQGKLVMSELVQDIAALALEIEGASATLFIADANAPAGGAWPLAYMNSFGGTIAAGTSEVQRNILGERVLGLAKSK